MSDITLQIIKLCESYHENTDTYKTKNGYSIRCKKGLWAVEAPTEDKASIEAMHYFRQYYADGEYD